MNVLPLAYDEALPAPPTERAARAWWPLAMLAIALAAAFWFSLYSTTAGGLDTPLALAPAAVPLAIWAGYLAVRRRGAAEAHRDGALDGVIGVGFIVAALWLVWLQPDSLGWRYWSERRDLLAFELFALGACCLLFGVAMVWRARPGLLVLALGSPTVLAWLQERLASPLALLTAGAARLIGGALGLHFLQTADPTMFRGVSDGGTAYYIIIADVCSGLASWVTMLLMVTPVALYLGFGAVGALVWLAVGLVLASIANIIRVSVLLFVAQHVDPGFALGVVHPILGALLLFMVVAALVIGVEGVPLPSWQWSPTVTRRSSAILLTLAAVAGIGQARLLPFQQLPPGGPPGPAVGEPLGVLPRLPGWQADLVRELTWQNLFGPASRSYLVNYVSPAGLRVTTQVVATPDLRKMLTYTPDQCGVYHGEDVRGQRQVDLGLGEIGYLVDSVEQVPIDREHPDQGLRPLQFNVLYWYVPFSMRGQVWNARFTLILDSDADSALPEVPARSGGLAPGGASFERVDSALVTLGRQMIGTLQVA